ncbi:MAG TPA: hypothetical protein PK406_11895, partial [Verrucomicrobiota bacterium]|nr:hypothetical protein [Verrucomicrobiota bacterium]
DAKDLGSFGAILAGSIPVAPTNRTKDFVGGCDVMAACWHNRRYETYRRCSRKTTGEAGGPNGSVRAELALPDTRATVRTEVSQDGTVMPAGGEGLGFARGVESRALAPVGVYLLR